MTLALVLTLSRAGIIGLVGAGAVFVAALSTRTRGLVRMLGVTSLTMMLMVALLQAGTGTILGRFAGAASSLEARGRIWDVAAQTATRFWQTGTGLNTFSAMTLLTNVRFEQHFSEAHNDYLQLAAEGGVLVGVPLIGLLVSVLVTIHRRMRESAASPDLVGRWIRFGSVISLGAIGAQEAVDFSLQIPANAALFAVVLAIALHRAPSARVHA
jgi:O-antigen ligase